MFPLRLALFCPAFLKAAADGISLSVIASAFAGVTEDAAPVLSFDRRQRYILLEQFISSRVGPGRVGPGRINAGRAMLQRNAALLSWVEARQA